MLHTFCAEFCWQAEASNDLDMLVRHVQDTCGVHNLHGARCLLLLTTMVVGACLP